MTHPNEAALEALDLINRLKTDNTIETIIMWRSAVETIRSALLLQPVADTTPSNEQIDYMVSRFLSWKLPENFNPDGGISATRPNYAPGVKWAPTGTNLLDCQQAKEMVLHLLEGLPSLRSGAEVQPVAVVKSVSGSLGSKDVCIHATVKDLASVMAVGTKLYAAPLPSPQGVVISREDLTQATEIVGDYISELECADPKFNRLMVEEKALKTRLTAALSQGEGA